MILSQILSRILKSQRRPSKEPILPLFSAGFLMWILALLLTSCSSIRRVQTIPLETLRHDTLYINKEHYDSIYLNNSHLIDRGGDTIVIKDTKTEYRFRFLRDTIYKTRIDSIPYEVRTTITKEVRKPPNLFDYLCYLSFGILLGIVGWKVIKIIPSRH